MSDEKYVSVSVCFEVLDSEIYGGVGSIGYFQMNLEFDLKDEIRINRDTIDAYRSMCARLCGVGISKVRCISKDEYEDNTEE